MLSKLKGPSHFLISAKTGEGVSELFFKIIELINHKLNNIKIIDQIEEKEERLEKDEGEKKGSQYEAGLKEVPCESASTLSAIKLEQVAMEQNKRSCC